MDFSIGDIVNMKKQHPCGCYEWEILRVGMDFKIKCVKCGRMVMLSRAKFEKDIKKSKHKNHVGCWHISANQDKADEFSGVHNRY